MFDWPYSLAGFVVGAIVGLTGVGGGSLMTPILVLLFGVSPVTADHVNPERPWPSLDRLRSVQAILRLKESVGKPRLEAFSMELLPTIDALVCSVMAVLHKTIPSKCAFA